MNSGQRLNSQSASPALAAPKPSEAEATLCKIAAIIQQHQAEGGISSREAMSEIIAIVESAPMQINTGHNE